MIRTLLATTALAALISTGAIAQDTAPATDAMAPAATDTMTPATGTDAMTPPAMWAHFDISEGYVAVDTDNLVTQLIDQPVYSSTGDDAEEIGNVSDLIFNKDGQITAVVIGVGGFLGIGEKSVAVDFSNLEFTVAADNTERWVLPTTADALNNAPDFVWKDDKPYGNANSMATDSMNTTTGAAPADSMMSPADPAATTTDSAAVPMNSTREGYSPVDYEALTADNLTGATVIGPDGEDIAKVGDILLTADGKVDAMVVDFGGFLGLAQKRVAVGMDNLEFAANDSGDLVIYSDFTREQLEAQPEYDEATYATDPTQRATDM
ncbi:MAG: PRC-barrel domain-containing protein [Devosia sp.]